LPNNILLDPIIVITWNFEYEGEFIHVAQLVDLLRKYEDKIGDRRKIRLYIPYMPYARQDKPICNDSTFAGVVFSELLDNLDVDEISSVDVHNPKIFEWLRNFRNSSVDYMISDIIKAEKIDVVVFPDKSARYRYEKDIKKWCPSVQILHGEKIRNQATGNIEKLEIVGSMSWTLGKSSGKYFRYLVVDDIFDGGASPTKAAQGLNLSHNDYLVGYFSHCLCTKGLDVAKNAGYSKLYDYRGLFYDFTV
jgi:ribose-phosphate pyrophosphokinase